MKKIRNLLIWTIALLGFGFAAVVIWCPKYVMNFIARTGKNKGTITKLLLVSFPENYFFEFNKKIGNKPEMILYSELEKQVKDSKDEWDRDFKSNSITDREYIIYSLGPDGKADTDDDINLIIRGLYWDIYVGKTSEAAKKIDDSD